MSFDPVSYAMGKAAGGGGGSTIVSKTITANGTYNASSDNADGYDPVTVNVSGVPLLTREAWNALTPDEIRTYGLVAVQDADSGYARGFLYNGANYGRPPAFIDAKYMNGGATGSISHTFDGGKYTIMLSLVNGKPLSNLSVLLNGNDIANDLTLCVHNTEAILLDIYALEVTFRVGDVISVSNSTLDSGKGVQLFVFQDVETSGVRLVGAINNNNTSFSIPASENAWYFEVAKFGYYKNANTTPGTNLFQAPSGATSTPCPNMNAYWDGGTYVLAV